jgi:hypothetical protein
LIWKRNEAQPTRYNGALFRSYLEAKVAEELDRLGVAWEYECDAHHALIWPEELPYLPDFTIVAPLPDDLDLPTWVEVKPADLLFALRDHIGIPERFDGIHREEITAQEIHDAGIEEIWKPKRLAELSGRDALVVYQINRTRSLSILMTPTFIELSKSHPLVNHKKVVADQERAEREAQCRADAAQRQAEWEQQRQLELAKAIEYARDYGRPARYDGSCLCGRQQPAEAIVVFQADGRWVAICRAHFEGAGGR